MALAADAVGIDVERRDPEALSEAATAFLSDEEQAAIARRPCSERDELMLALWTGKEAVVKALGVGFSGCEPNRVCFAVSPVRPPSLAQVVDHDHEPSLGREVVHSRRRSPGRRLLPHPSHGPMSLLALTVPAHTGQGARGVR